jgi:hypothetical protein
MKKLLGIFAVVVILAGAAGSYYLFDQNMDLKKQVAELKADPRVIAQQEVAQTVAMVAKVVELPQGEDPVVATVTDKDKLKDQPFFGKAENGDKVLIYATAKRIYLFRPSGNKLIEAAPLNIGQTTATPATPGSSVSPTPRPSEQTQPRPQVEL